MISSDEEEAVSTDEEGVDQYAYMDKPKVRVSLRFPFCVACHATAGQLCAPSTRFRAVCAAFCSRETTMNAQVLQLFEECTEKQLERFPGCSSKRAALIVSLRPFTSFGDLVCF